MTTTTLNQTGLLHARCAEWLATLNAKEIDRRSDGTQYATFTLDKSGRKFTRVVMTVEGGGQRSVHAFVDNATGDVLMPAGWKGPAKGARFNLLDADSFASLLERCEFAGGYLYMSRK